MHPMPKATALVRAFFTDVEGATAIEYALLGSLMALVALAGFSALSTAVIEVFDRWTSAVSEAITD